MARRAGETLFVELAIHLRILSQRARQNPDRIVAAIAVTGELNALRAGQDIHAGAVERRPEGIGMERLAPLVIGFLVAMRAV